MNRPAQKKKGQAINAGQVACMRQAGGDWKCPATSKTGVNDEALPSRGRRAVRSGPTEDTLGWRVCSLGLCREMAPRDVSRAAFFVALAANRINQQWARIIAMLPNLRAGAAIKALHGEGLQIRQLTTADGCSDSRMSFRLDWDYSLPARVAAQLHHTIWTESFAAMDASFASDWHLSGLGSHFAEYIRSKFVTSYARLRVCLNIAAPFRRHRTNAGSPMAHRCRRHSAQISNGFSAVGALLYVFS